MKPSRHLLLASALGIAGLALPLSATTVVGTGTAASCTEASLDAAIGEANATSGIVSFNCGAAPHTLVVTTEKALASGVIVDGGGKITLSGGNTTRIFTLFQGAAVALKDLELIRGSASHGGCLLAHSSPEEPAQLSLTRVQFETCKAVNFGGAIAATQAHLQIAASRFAFNQATSGGGGAISLNGGSLLARDTDLVFNDTFDQGGALQLWFASVQIEGGLFFGNASGAINSANAGGGAMLLRASFGTVENTEFFFNRVASRGGAVHLQDGADLAFDDSGFDGNLADFGGGGIFVDVTARAILRRSTFESNWAGNLGGALYGRGEIYAQASTFYRNQSEIEGSAIYLDNGGSLELISATLVDNFRSDSILQPAQLSWSQATVTVHNTLLQSPEQPAPACSGPGGAFSFSMWQDASCPALSGAGNFTFASVPLRPLGFSCGSAATERTRTFALSAGSLAIDNGACRPTDPAFDQRGMPRPQGAACDIGATEFFVPCDGPFFADGFETGNTQSWSIVLP